MQVFYALYDQSFANGPQYWTWFAEELSQSVRDAAASKQGAFQTRPKNANQLADSDILGGILCVEKEWFVVYRFFNGGYDPQGRPGRGVMATAWVRQSEADGANLYSLLNCPAFWHVQKLAPGCCPVPKPENLAENLKENWPERIDVQASRYAPLRGRYDFRNWSFTDFDDVQTFAELFPELAKRGVTHLKIVQTGRPLVTFSEEPLTSAVCAVESPISPPKKNDSSGQAVSSKSNSLLSLLVNLLILELLLYVVIGLFQVGMDIGRVRQAGQQSGQQSAPVPPEDGSSEGEIRETPSTAPEASAAFSEGIQPVSDAPKGNEAQSQPGTTNSPVEQNKNGGPIENQ